MAKFEVEVVTTKATDKFNRLLFTHPKMRTLIRKLIAEKLRQARNKTAKDMRQFVGTDMEHSQGDPRQAYRAVKYSIWKQDLGGSISIFTKRRATNTKSSFARPRKLDRNPHQRGGNRMKRSKRTEQMDSYWGNDRSFILRWLSGGTDENRQSRFGNRGGIAGRRFFSPSARQHIIEAAEEIERQIMQAEQEIFNE